MQAAISSRAVIGMDSVPVSVEVSIAVGLPAFIVVGLPDAAVQESRERVRSGIVAAELDFPLNRITVNLAPADLRKEGPSFDLPIALAILAASGQLPPGALEGYVAAGELSLGGDIRPVRGALSIAMSTKAAGCRGVIVPEANACEAALVEGLTVIPARHLGQVADFATGRRNIEPAGPRDPDLEGCAAHDVDFADVKGQAHAKRALEVAAAGGHNVLMIGPPGSGKTMLARRVPTILPRFALSEAIEVTKIYSVCGMLQPGAGLVSSRPFRAPHHTISRGGLAGGGTRPRPGEISLAHHGVLFLDELPEFGKSALQVLRQPLEDGTVTISRARIALTYPASFTLLAAMNPCPCGHFGDTARPCRCTQTQIFSYRERIGGPLLDRMDIQVEVPRLAAREVTGSQNGEPSKAIRDRVETARSVQRQRLGSNGSPSPACNASMNSRQLRRFCRLDSEAARFMEVGIERLGLSARAFDRILKVARTVADLAGREHVELADLAEAMQYRCLDREWVS